MGHDDHYIYLGRLRDMKDVDRKLERIAFEGRLREAGEKVKKTFYYLIGKKYEKDEKI